MRPIDADAFVDYLNKSLEDAVDSSTTLEGFLLAAAIKEAFVIDLKDEKVTPTIDVVEVKHGKWIITSEFEDCCYAKCNQCNITQVFYFNKRLTNFCPNCGAEMEEVER